MKTIFDVIDYKKEESRKLIDPDIITTDGEWEEACSEYNTKNLILIEQNDMYRTYLDISPTMEVTENLVIREKLIQ